MLSEKEIREINDDITFNEIMLETYKNALDDFFKGTNEDYKVIYNRKHAIIKMILFFVITFFLTSAFIITSIYEKSDTNMWKDFLVADLIAISVFNFIVVKSISNEVILHNGYLKMKDRIERTENEIKELKSKLEEQ